MMVLANLKICLCGSNHKNTIQSVLLIKWNIVYMYLHAILTSHFHLYLIMYCSHMIDDRLHVHVDGGQSWITHNPVFNSNDCY